jgi:PAS domain S-box-containing protein
MRSERWLRGLILLGFLIFTVLFYRLVLLPFHDMRRRATALIRTGVLPPAPGNQENDPEYVMAAFDQLLTHFSVEARRQTIRADDSQRQARNVERFNEYMLRSLSTGVVILAHDGRVLRFNRAAERILNLGGPEVIGRQYRDIGLPHPLTEVLRDGLEIGKVYGRHEVEIELDDSGETIHLGVNTSRIRDGRERVVGLSLLLTDLTKIKKLENEVAESQRLADLGELAAGLAHQLRNSIAAIFGYGKMLRRTADPQDVHAKWVDAIIEETSETSDMIARFLDFARPLEVQRGSVQLVSVIHGAIAAVGSVLTKTGAQLSFPECPQVSSVQVIADELLLKQVFVNLIQNAAEAGGPGGTIEITFPAMDDSAATPGLVAISVSDSGGGIPKEDRARIFHPFFTTKDEGTGLGLALARKIVAAHQGTLTLASTAATGSTFTVSLPLAGQSDARAANYVPEAVSDSCR